MRCFEILLEKGHAKRGGGLNNNMRCFEMWFRWGDAPELRVKQ